MRFSRYRSPRTASSMSSSASLAASTGRRSALLLLAAVIVLWGLNWPVMKLGLTHMGPMTFVTWRMAMAAACMFAFAAATGRLHWPTRRDWPIVLSVGLFQMGGFMTLCTFGLQYVEASRSSILAYTTPLWVVPGAILLFGEKVAGWRLFGVLVGLAGVAVMFNPVAIDWSSRDVLIGNGALMLGALLWAGQILQIRGHRWDSPPLELVGWQLLVATLMVLPIALVTEAGRPVDWGWELSAILVYNGPIATAFCFFAVITLNRALPAITTSLGMLGVPAAGLVFSALMLGEPINATKGMGLALIACGLGFVAVADRRTARAAS